MCVSKSILTQNGAVYCTKYAFLKVRTLMLTLKVWLFYRFFTYFLVLIALVGASVRLLLNLFVNSRFLPPTEPTMADAECDHVTAPTVTSPLYSVCDSWVTSRNLLLGIRGRKQRCFLSRFPLIVGS